MFAPQPPPPTPTPTVETDDVGLESFLSVSTFLDTLGVPIFLLGVFIKSKGLPLELSGVLRRFPAGLKTYLKEVGGW